MKILFLTLFVSGLLSPTAEGKSIVALGDSLSTGFNATLLLDNWRYSWITGSASRRIRSITKRVSDFYQADVSFQNLAQDGATALELTGQMDRIAQAPDWITILVGANDLCEAVPAWSLQLAQYTQSVTQVVQTLVQRYPKSRIVLLGVPDIARLRDVMADQCQNKWDLAAICSPILASGLTPGQRTAFKTRWSQLNKALKDLARSLPDSVRWVGETSTTAFRKEHISEVDCFHPSIGGLSVLAETVWKTGAFTAK